MKIKNAIFVLIILALFSFGCDSSSDKTEKEKASPVTATVEITGGTIEGLPQGTDQNTILTFKGIPFAAPPVGDLRWKAPEPVEPWTGVKQTHSFCDACMQTPNAMGNTAPVNEDCLYINVWTPAKMTNDKLPVIYWIHGGGYVGGSTSTPMYDGTGFAQKGVVFVAVAYRLGPFGFLAHPELSSESGKGSGTYGIQDMIYGLKWVKDNIEKFGGNPENVTIFGHSAGGAAVSVLAGSPAAHGLFNKVICMSGGSFTPLRTSREAGIDQGIPSLTLAEQNGEDLLEVIGVNSIKEARLMAPEDIQKKVDEAKNLMRFRPVADGNIIPDDLYSLYEAGKFNYTPVLLGHTSDEVGAFGGNENVTPDDFIKKIRGQYKSYADTLLAAYPHATEEEATLSSRNLRNDSSFSWNTWTWSRLQSRKGEKAFQYRFDYHPDSPDGGSGHGSDVPYAFQTLEGDEEGVKKDDLKLSDMISTYWVNFAKTGDPNGTDLLQWPVFSEDDSKIMEFDETPGVEPLPALDRLKIFDGFINELRKNK